VYTSKQCINTVFYFIEKRWLINNITEIFIERNITIEISRRSAVVQSLSWLLWYLQDVFTTLVRSSNGAYMFRNYFCKCIYSICITLEYHKLLR